MGDTRYSYILQEYYEDHSDLEKILDLNDDTKHGIRTHSCLNIKYNGNNILIPLRKKTWKGKKKIWTDRVCCT